MIRKIMYLIAITLICSGITSIFMDIYNEASRDFLIPYICGAIVSGLYSIAGTVIFVK